MEMSDKDMQEVIARKIIPNLNILEKIGLKPNFAERAERT